MFRISVSILHLRRRRRLLFSVLLSSPLRPMQAFRYRNALSQESSRFVRTNYRVSMNHRCRSKMRWNNQRNCEFWKKRRRRMRWSKKLGIFLFRILLRVFFLHHISLYTFEQYNEIITTFLRVKCGLAGLICVFFVSFRCFSFRYGFFFTLSSKW